jgi:hypothetical protein
MKTSVKQLVAGTFIALILMVGNVYTTGTETKASSHEAIESTLHLEKWMTDDAIWNTNSISIAEFVVETETDLVLEDWMTDTELWSLNNNFVAEVESEMELEGWMTNDETWNTANNDIESELTVEPWMINNNIWE